ncbi:tetratricopeptide repeat protein [Lacinutrix neustonica]|uniref:Tetratricopeptide repeat protein n=1 Tax=Lacinutrix neustonica TaxID=2980107 RepID=A0A9E8SCD4_9FLAO|nr:tetratricopeptide repeat protein [Lacinutrix neustonica]WAC00891.1 tetratricopeptide repeat protein [Lacinutrix neustonica]
MKKVIYIFLFFCGLLSAQNEVLFDQANTLYNEGKFVEALDKYETILKGDNHSAALYFNMANTHYKLNHIAPSIYYYEKAAAMAPNDQEISNNMAFANNMTIDAIDTIPRNKHI